MSIETDLERPSVQEPELDLLLHWERAAYRPRPWISASGSILAHVVIFLIFMAVPARDFVVDMPPPREIDLSKATPLVAPQLPKFTQKAPNTTKPAEQLDLAGLVARPQSIPAPPLRQAPRSFVAPPVSPKVKPQDTPEIEAPKLAQNLPAALGTSQFPSPAIAPPPQFQEKPKLAFENPGATMGNSAAKGLIQAPKTSIDDAARGAMRTGQGTTVVGDAAGDATPALPNMPGSSGKVASSLELLSDPMGVDFKPYLARVLAAVRRNWFAVMPESARMGQRGRAVIVFAIANNGSVPKLVIQMPSGSEHLDRAAVAGISASNPFPPLPSEFRGNQIRLSLVFSYNMPK